MLGAFGFFPFTLKPGMIHILGDALFRVPHVEEGPIVNDVEVPHITFSDVM